MGNKFSGAKPTKFLEVGDLMLNQNLLIANVKRTQVRDAIRRYKDRKFSTIQVGDNVMVVRIQ